MKLATILISLGFFLYQFAQVEGSVCSGRFDFFSTVTVTSDDLDNYLDLMDGHTGCISAVGHSGDVKTKWCSGPRWKSWVGVYLASMRGACICPKSHYVYGQTFHLSWVADPPGE